VKELFQAKQNNVLKDSTVGVGADACDPSTQEDHEIQVSLGYIVRACLNNTQKKKTKQQPQDSEKSGS
jgi:hypothetical protein